MSALFPVILSGGSGTRLWPLSRSMHPKQFIRFDDSQASSFLGATLARLTPADGFRPSIILWSSRVAYVNCSGEPLGAAGDEGRNGHRHRHCRMWICPAPPVR